MFRDSKCRNDDNIHAMLGTCALKPNHSWMVVIDSSTTAKGALQCAKIQQLLFYHVGKS